MEAARGGVGIRTQFVGVSAAALIAAVPAPAAAARIDVPAGTVGQSAIAIGRQARVNVAVADGSILNRRTAAIRGQTSAGGALSQLARASGLQLRKVGANSYVLAAQKRPLLTAAVRRTPGPALRPARPIRQALRAPKPEPEMHDIIVTGSKRDTLLRRYAGAWSRLDGRDFKALGVRGADAIESRSIGFSSTHLGAGRNKLFIRGIADSSFSGPTQSPVGQYFGDVRTGYSGADPDLKLVDVQSVEVLEGPQGTLYGSGALGGIVLINPNTPVLGERAGMIASGTSITRKGAAGLDTAGMFNLPIGDQAAVRAVLYRAEEGGYIDNLATGARDINDVRTTGGRGTASLNLGADWFVHATGAAQRIRGLDSQYADRDGDNLSRSSDVDQPFASEFAMASLAVRKDAGEIRFRSATALTRQDLAETFDASVPAIPRALRQESRARTFSHETRAWRPMADGYSWLAGISITSHRYRVSRQLHAEEDVADLAGVVSRVRETTLFGEAGLELTPRIEATLGARYTMASLSGSGEHLSPVAVFPAEAKRTKRSFLPSASVVARPLDKLTIFGRYQQGFRPGGISIASDVVNLYRSDRLRTGELGFRLGRPGLDPFDLEGSATFSRWNDIQADFLDPAGLPITDNIGDGRVRTLALKGGARLTEDLQLSAGFAWNDGKITRVALDYRLALSSPGLEMTIPNIARVVGRASLDWRTAVGSDWTLESNLYARYVGRSRLGVGPQLGDEQGQYLDSGLLMRLSNGGRHWTLNITNLADEIGNRFAFGAPIGGSHITPLRPRTIRLGFEQGF